ncbi:MAG: hypothetical protein PVH61_26000 [Candidatus Aminicenantes bacterium]|jgi:hypothetical protein
MSQKLALNSVKNAFYSKIESSVGLFAALKPFATELLWDGIHGWEPIHPEQAKKIFSLAFLDVLVGWEDFIAACFIRYLAGAKAPSGYFPRLRTGECESIKHAYEVLSGIEGFDPLKRFLRWSSWNEILQKARIFFENGKPFSLVTDQERQRLNDAFIIRNRIAHSSEKCRHDFKRIARQHLGMPDGGKLKRGYSVGALLLETSSRGFGRVKKGHFFINYMNLFIHLVNKIAP